MQPAQAEGGGSSSNNLKKWGPIGAIVLVVAAVILWNTRYLERAAADLGFTRVVALFQPHRYSRVAALSLDFADAFSCADSVVLMEVYGAGEAPIPGVSGKSLLDDLLRRHPRSRSAYLPHRFDVVPYLASRVRVGDLVMTMGAGDVTTIGPELLAELTRQEVAGELTCR